LFAHYRGLREDRYKKVVAAVFQYAKHHGAEVIVFEDLKKLLPDAANERGVNSALQRWNRGQVVGFARKIAEDYGLRVVTVPAFHTSMLCARCGLMGARFNRDRSGFSMDRLGHWFACPECGRQIHADINASENLHKVLLGTFPACKKIARQPATYQLGGEVVLRDDVDNAVHSMMARAAIGETPF